MVRRAAILHGTAGNPNENWQPWLRRQLERRGYEVFVPQLPCANHPDWSRYEPFLKTCGWDFADNLVIGHSSGSTAMLRLMQSDWFPRVDAAVFVGLFVNVRMLEADPAEWYNQGMFDELFPEQFRWRTIRDRAGYRLVIHADDDPFCAYDDAQVAAANMDAKLVTVPGGKHLSIGSGGIDKLPWAIQSLETRGIL